jgi:hypothetical protein
VRWSKGEKCRINDRRKRPYSAGANDEDTGSLDGCEIGPGIVKEALKELNSPFQIAFVRWKGRGEVGEDCGFGSLSGRGRQEHIFEEPVDVADGLSSRRLEEEVLELFPKLCGGGGMPGQ